MSLFSNALSFAAAAALSLLALAPTPAQAEPWALDASHSQVGFKVRHLTISWVRGAFSDVNATLDYDGKDLSKLKAEVRIGVASVSTENEKRDEHLRSPDFFDAANHEAMTFVSKKVANISKDKSSFDLIGDLTIRGVTHEVTLAVTDWASGVVDPWGNVKAGASASTTIDRTKFGLTWNNAIETGGLVVGEEVKIELELEFNQQK